MGKAWFGKRKLSCYRKVFGAWTGLLISASSLGVRYLVSRSWISRLSVNVSSNIVTDNIEC